MVFVNQKYNLSIYLKKLVDKVEFIFNLNYFTLVAYTKSFLKPSFKALLICCLVNYDINIDQQI